MRIPGWRIIAAIVSGVALGLLLPPYDLGGLAWVGFLPLLVALWSMDGRRPGWKGFGLAWLTGWIYFLMNLHWLTEVSGVGWAVLCCYLALFPGFWGAFVAKWANPWRRAGASAGGSTGAERKIREKLENGKQDSTSHWRQSARSLRIAFSVAAVWCGLEFLRGWLFTGFGWNNVGVAFHQTPVMAQSADILGICGLAFVPVFLQAVMVQTGRRLWLETKAGRLRPHVDFGIAALLVALSFCYGVWRIYSTDKGESIRLKALLVQLNIPQEAARRLWEPHEVHFAYENETLGALESIEEGDVERLKLAAGGDEEIRLRTPDWIMWPESSLTGRLLMEDGGDWGMYDENMETLSLIREAGDFTVVLGLNEVESEYQGPHLMRKEEARVWNSLVVLTPDYDLTTARKQHRVIFGEYIPLVEELPLLKAFYKMQTGVEFGGSLAKGEGKDPIVVDLHGERVSMIPTVCFEDTVPRLMRRFVRGGPQVIVNVTNDGWFRNSPAAAQHFANARFRSIELRRPMIRCANTGVSAAVDSIGSTSHPDTGAIQELRDDKGSHFTRGWMLAEVDIPLEPGWSLYLLVGDLGVVVLGLAGFATGFVGRKRV